MVDVVRLAEMLAGEGIDAEVIDLRTIRPLNSRERQIAVNYRELRTGIDNGVPNGEGTGEGIGSTSSAVARTTAALASTIPAPHSAVIQAP